MRSLERTAKRGLVRIIGPLFPSRRSTSEVERILLVRVDDRLGNLILLSPTLDWLRRECPGAQIGMVASSAFASLYAQDPRVDHLHILDKGKQKLLFPLLFRDLARVGAVGYDAVLDCSDRNAFSFNSALYTRASRAPRRIGFANELARHYLTVETPPPMGKHAARDPLVLAGALLGRSPPPIEECRLSLHLPPASAVWRETLASMSAGASEPIVGMHIGGRGRKRWPLSRYVELAHGLLDSRLRPWIFRGPMESGVQALFRDAAGRGLVLVPQASVVQVGQAMARCRLVIAPDTGPMHLASAVGSPTLALFLDSDAERYRPIAPEDRWIDARGGDLPVSRVLETALSMVSETRRVGGR